MNTNLKKGVVQEKRALGLTCLFIGTLLGAAPPMLGGMLQSGFSVAGVALVILIGYGIVCVYMGFIAMQASDTGLSIHDTAGAAMGTVAAQLLASLPIAVASIGWFGIQAAMLGAGFSAGWQGITGMTIPPAFGAIVWGGLTALIVMQGYKWLTYFAYAAVPLCILIVAYVLYRLGGQGGLSAILAYRPAQPAPLLSGISVAVSSYALMGVMAGDYFRHTSSRMGAAKGMSGILPTGCIMFCLGAAGVVATGQSDVSALFSQWGHPVMGLFLLVASTISINIMNGYSGGLGVVKMLGLDERQFKLAAGVACGVGVIMGASGILSLFSSFLSLVSSLIPPLAGVVIGSYWLSSMGGGGG
ncbi:MAG: cytosine permease [Treponema sp.]|jgi:cytosine permease|nr:cytosine permease [Treponema sp.]